MRWLVLLVAACTDPQGVSSGSTCPPAPVTYADFGQTFFQSYCLECHSTTKTGTARQSAPVTIDFDTQALVRMHTSNIDRLAAFGPDAKNTQMPVAGKPKPSNEERELLGEYIACEVGR